MKVEAGATIAIWSSGEVEHKPKEGQYVMKVGQQKISNQSFWVYLDYVLVLGGHMEDGGHDGDGAVHEGGWGDGDQGHTEGKGELRVFKVGNL